MEAFELLIVALKPYAKTAKSLRVDFRESSNTPEEHGRLVSLLAECLPGVRPNIFKGRLKRGDRQSNFEYITN